MHFHAGGGAQGAQQQMNNGAAVSSGHHPGMAATAPAATATVSPDMHEGS